MCNYQIDIWWKKKFLPVLKAIWNLIFFAEELTT